MDRGDGSGTADPVPDGPVAQDLLPLVYDELRAVAARYLSQEHPGHTLEPTALVHEVYLKLADQHRAKWKSRAHFLAVAAQAMRRILINHAKSRGRLKRGGPDALRVPLDDAFAAFETRAIDLEALDEALQRLAAMDSAQARIVELRFFGGLSVDETAEVLGVSPRTVHREWDLAKAWLRGEVCKGDQT
ncbi:MAG TPA: sigma-70 family RNA polymerase sigma factor [Phycisphaerae bacterium]|jgi:RNA polymerase sigma factor (TIGR02999 family)